MSMHVNLSSEMEGYIKSKVASGFYGNATEVIRDAVRRMQAEEARLSAWHAAIAQGDAELDRRQGAAYSTVLMDSLATQAIQEAGSALPLDSDVIP